MKGMELLSAVLLCSTQIRQRFEALKQKKYESEQVDTVMDGGDPSSFDQSGWMGIGALQQYTLCPCIVDSMRRRWVRA